MGVWHVFDIKGKGPGGMAQKGDDASVAYGLHALLQKLERLDRSTFPGDSASAHSANEWERTNYAEQCRFLEVVRECEKMLWGVRDWVSFRYDRTWGQTARLMQARMQPLLWEVCKFNCSHSWYCEDIHRIRGLVDRICKWQADAVTEKEAAQAEKDASQAEKDAAFGTAMGKMFKAAQAFKAAKAVV